MNTNEIKNQMLERFALPVARAVLQCDRDSEPGDALWTAMDKALYGALQGLKAGIGDKHGEQVFARAFKMAKQEAQ